MSSADARPKARAPGAKARAADKKAEGEPAQEKGVKRVILEPGERAAVKAINDWLYEHRGEIHEVRSALEAGNYGSAKAQKRRKEQGNFDPATYKVFKQIPKYYLGEMLVQHCGMSKAEIDTCDYHDHDAVRFLAQYFFGIGDSTSIPKQLQGDKGYISNFFSLRHKRLGSRGGDAFRARGLLSEESKLDWVKGWVYSLEWNADQTLVQSVTHVSSGDKVDVSEYHLTAGTQFGGNHSDQCAFFKKGKVELKVADFFENDLDHNFSKETLAEDAKSATELAVSSSVKSAIESASANEMFSLSKARTDQKRNIAIKARPRVPSKGLAAPLLAPDALGNAGA